MNQKLIKFLTTIVTIMMVISMGASISYAASTAEKNKEETDTSSDAAITPSGLTASYKGTGDIKTVGQKIMGIVNTVGVVVAVVILMVLGIKYMMGSAEEKAEYKKTMIPYIVGAVLIFGATTIANAIYSFANGLNT